MLDNVSLVFLLLSCAVSFGLGRLFVRFRDKKRKAVKDQADAQAARARRERPPEPPSNNKAKRKRQLQQKGKDAGV